MARELLRIGRPSKILSGALAALALSAFAQCTSERGESMVASGASSGASSTPGGASNSGAGSANANGAGTLAINVGASDAGGAGPEDDGPCEGLECQQTTCKLGTCTVPACDAGKPLTTVSGRVFDPAGKVPLYNVVVYVPNGPVPAFTAGASCDRCDASIANPVASAITDTHGDFKLEDVPVGSDIPLVIQVGKWRRQIVVPSVAACADTPLTDPNLTRLPKNQSEGDIPLIAITTGGADSMECLPRRMGLDDTEFTAGSGTGRIHLYAGHDNPPNKQVAAAKFAPALNAGANLSRANLLWNSAESLKKYDIVIFSCEGDVIEEDKTPADRAEVYKYVSEGGRLFASHWHHLWFSKGPAPVPAIGTWSDRKDPQDPAIGVINTAFPKGAAFSEWLVNVGASQTAGQLSIAKSRDNMQFVDETKATKWISIDKNDSCVSGCEGKEPCLTSCSTNPGAVEYTSFNAPLDVPEEQKCGRAVYTDLHVSATGNDKPGGEFPAGCEVRDLSSQEKAVEFMLFDLSACIMDDRKPPRPPVVH